MLYYFLLIYSLFIDLCYSLVVHNYTIAQCIYWLIDFTKIIACYNGYNG